MFHYYENVLYFCLDFFWGDYQVDELWHEAAVAGAATSTGEVLHTSHNLDFAHYLDTVVLVLRKIRDKLNGDFSAGNAAHCSHHLPKTPLTNFLYKHVSRIHDSYPTFG